MQVPYSCKKEVIGISEEFYNKIMTTPFEYAKALADF